MVASGIWAQLVDEVWLPGGIGFPAGTRVRVLRPTLSGDGYIVEVPLGAGVSCLLGCVPAQALGPDPESSSGTIPSNG